MCYVCSGKNVSSFNPFMHARLSESFGLCSTMSETHNVEPVQHVASKEDISDLATRKDGRLSDIGPGSLWQQGPKWLSQPQHTWPCTIDFCRATLPDVETKPPIKILLTCHRDVQRNPWMIQVLENSKTFKEALHKLAQSSWISTRPEQSFLPMLPKTHILSILRQS